MYVITIPQPFEPAQFKTQTVSNENISTNTIIKTYHITLEKDEDGRYVASCKELKGVVTDGVTEDEAIENVREAVEAMLESLGITEEFNLVVS